MNWWYILESMNAGKLAIRTTTINSVDCVASKKCAIFPNRKMPAMIKDRIDIILSHRINDTRNHQLWLLYIECFTPLHLLAAKSVQPVRNTYEPMIKISLLRCSRNACKTVVVIKESNIRERNVRSGESERWHRLHPEYNLLFCHDTDFLQPFNNQIVIGCWLDNSSIYCCHIVISIPKNQSLT